MADVFGREVVTLTGAAEGGAYGAALAAGVGSGQWASMDEALAKLQTSASYVPDPKDQLTYQKVFDGHRRLYEDLSGVYEDVETARSNS
jgi:xylulokinase